VATDLNPRAIEFGRFNATLNDCTGIEWRVGDLLEPAVGERFDLVVANPPYVVSPETSFMFRDSDRPVDELSRVLIEQLPNVLSDGGIATVLVSWAQPPDDTTFPPVRWVENTGCDNMVVVSGLQTPIEAATVWNSPLLSDPEQYAQRVGSWLRYYEENNVAAIGYGAVVMRRRSGSTGWTTTIPLQPNPGQASKHLLRLFDAHTVLAHVGSNAAALNALSLSVAPDIELVRTWRPDASPSTAELRLIDGLGFAVDIDPVGAALVEAFAKTRRVDHAIAEVAPSPSPPSDTTIAAAHAMIRQLLGLGFLTALG
jgi:hypothetical protein